MAALILDTPRAVDSEGSYQRALLSQEPAYLPPLHLEKSGGRGRLQNESPFLTPPSVSAELYSGVGVSLRGTDCLERESP